MAKAKKAKGKAGKKPVAKAKAKPVAKAKAKPVAKAKTKPVAKAKTKPVAKAKAQPAAKTKPTAAEARPTNTGSSAAITALWQRIEALFAKHQPGENPKLRPPATEAQIAAAEKALGVRFPDDYRASLLVHDGQEDDADVRWLPFAQRLGSLESLVKCWKDDRGMFSDPDEKFFDDDNKVEQTHLHPKHIPIAGSAYWDYDRLMLDYAPGPEGTAGQVIARNDIDLEHVAPTFTALLEECAQRIIRGD